MNINNIKESIKTNVYHINSESNVPLHKHNNANEIFYCIKGSGFGLNEAGETPLNVGDCFIAPAGTLHSLKSETDLYVCAFIIPVV